VDNQALERMEYISLGLQMVLMSIIKKIHTFKDTVSINFWFCFFFFVDLTITVHQAQKSVQ